MPNNLTNPTEIKIDENSHQIVNCHRFKDQAMATLFEIWIVDEDAMYAEQAAAAAFEELHRLEQELSRFVKTSDISRINAMKPGEKIIVGLDCFACVKQAIELSQDTYGTFDISIGEFKDAPSNFNSSTFSALPYLNLDETEKSIELMKGSINLDLGGFGKGYALDCMAGLLKDWDLNQFMLHSGYSTVLTGDSPFGFAGWPLSIIDTNQNPSQSVYYLQNSAVSASGLKKGDHIVDPRTSKPATHRKAAWAWAQTAAISDALSTAFMIMSEEEIKRYLSANSEVKAVWL